MSRTNARLGIILLLLLGGAGCVNVQTTNNVALRGFEVVGAPGLPEECVTVSNYGYYLFYFIPLFCGNTVDGHLGNTVWFQNQVTLEKVQSVLIREVKPKNPQVTCLQPHAHETCFFSVIPYIGNSLGIVWYKQIDLSAVLVKPAN